jgi:hypothetical protein
MRWAGVALTSVACAACNVVLGLKTTVPADQGSSINFCDPLPFDPLRYMAQTQPGGFSVPKGTQICAQSGLEFVSFDDGDQAELTHELAGATYPFWTGLSHIGATWANPDGCTPYLPWRAGEPRTQDASSCGLMTDTDMVSLGCGNVMDGMSGTIAILCETPRPSVACRAQQDQRTYRLVPGAMRSFAAASAACNNPGEHVVEINSSAELAAVNQLASSMSAQPYWVGSQYAGTTWTTATGCPAVYAWDSTNAEPNLVTGTCVQNDVNGMHVHNCPDTTAHAICETNQ